MRLISLSALTGLVAFGVAAEAHAADTTTLRLTGARSTGGMLVPAARVLDRLTWDLSLSYAHEEGVVATEVPTGAIRGGDRSRTVDWIGSRDMMYLQFAASPADSLELTFGLPVLMGQSGAAALDVAAPRSDTTAMGDPRLGLRYAVVGDATSEWLWTIQGGLLLPGGGEDHAVGETRARADFAATAGYQSDVAGGAARWSALLHLGHRMGDRFSLGDQIFGDSVMVGGAFLVKHDVAGQLLQWSVEAMLQSITAPADAGRDPARNALEFLAGARYFLPWFYADVGAGVAAMNAGGTPDFRMIASLGTTGSRAAAPPVAGPTPLVAEPPPPREPKPEPEPEPVAEPVVEEAAEEPVDIRSVVRVAELERQAIFFATGRADLAADEERKLRSVAILLHDGGGHVRITGYADDQGTPERNRELSLRRAEAVRDALVEAGIDAARLEIGGEGDTQPVAPSTGFGRSINRRVGFAWVDRR